MENEKYNQYSLNYIKKLVARGQKYAAEGKTYNDILNEEKNLCMDEYEFITLGMKFPKWNVPEIKTYYRIGRPAFDSMSGTYKSSYNFMDNRPEMGISVATAEWLTGTLFDISDDNIARRGVWAVKGIELPVTGGDDEPLIIAMDWAEKTTIKTYKGFLNRLTKEAENGQA